MQNCCGNCNYHKFNRNSDGWICTNEESDNYSDWTDYDDSCKEYEERD